MNQQSAKPEHTPGPWEATGTPCGTRTGLMSRGNGRPVAMLGITDALNPADVSLIAASPDLLAVCEEILNYWNANGELYVRLPALRAAVAKAKGETP